MTRFGPRIEPITSPTPGECAICYATDAGFDISSCVGGSVGQAYLHSRLGGAPRGEGWERQLVVVQPEINIFEL